MRVRVARDQTKVELIRDVKPQLCRCGKVVVIVVDARLARRQQIQWGDRSRAGVQVLQGGRIVKLIQGAAHATGLVEGIERSGFDAGVELRGTGAAFGDDVND